MNLNHNNTNETQHQHNILARNVQNQQENRLTTAEIGSLWQTFLLNQWCTRSFKLFWEI
jgi:hypothetical protein